MPFKRVENGGFLSALYNVYCRERVALNAQGCENRVLAYVKPQTPSHVHLRHSSGLKLTLSIQ